MGWWDDVESWVEGAYEDTKDWVEGAYEDTVDWAEGAAEDVADFAVGVGEAVYEKGKEIVDRTVQIFTPDTVWSQNGIRRKGQAVDNMRNTFTDTQLGQLARDMYRGPSEIGGCDFIAEIEFDYVSFLGEAIGVITAMSTAKPTFRMYRHQVSKQYMVGIRCETEEEARDIHDIGIIFDRSTTGNIIRDMAWQHYMIYAGIFLGYTEIDTELSSIIFVGHSKAGSVAQWLGARFMCLSVGYNSVELWENAYNHYRYLPLNDPILDAVAVAKQAASLLEGLNPIIAIIVQSLLAIISIGNTWATGDAVTLGNAIEVIMAKATIKYQWVAPSSYAAKRIIQSRVFARAMGSIVTNIATALVRMGIKDTEAAASQLTAGIAGLISYLLNEAWEFVSHREADYAIYSRENGSNAGSHSVYDMLALVSQFQYNGEPPPYKPVVIDNGTPDLAILDTEDENKPTFHYLTPLDTYISEMLLGGVPPEVLWPIHALEAEIYAK